MPDPTERMLAVLRGDIGRLVMENAALKARVQALEAENKEPHAAKEAPQAAMTEAQRQALLQQGIPGLRQQGFNGSAE